MFACQTGRNRDGSINWRKECKKLVVGSCFEYTHALGSVTVTLFTYPSKYTTDTRIYINKNAHTFSVMMC